MTTTYVLPTTRYNRIVANADLKNLLNSVFLELTGVMDETADIKRLEKLSKNPEPYLQSGPVLQAFLFGTVENPGVFQAISDAIPNGTGVNQVRQLTVVGNTLPTEANEIEGIAQDTSTYTQIVDNIDYTIPVWKSTTEERIQRNNFRIYLVTMFRVAMLLQLVTCSGSTDYQTVEDVDNDLADIQQRYFNIISNNVNLSSIINDNETILQINLTYGQYNALLAAESKRLYNIAEINLTSETNLRAFCLEYYYEKIDSQNKFVEIMELIQSLNPGVNMLKMTGTIKALEL